MELSQRQAVTVAARTWLRTPYHLNAKLKGVGVDCGTLLIATFQEAGLVDRVDAGLFRSDFHLHRCEEVYLEWVGRFCKQVERSPLPGDIILYRYGRIVSHAAIVTVWPEIIHATPQTGCILADGSQEILSRRQYGVFSFWEGRR
jgi:cell wall-associated NlpC family hydrolase